MKDNVDSVSIDTAERTAEEQSLGGFPEGEADVFTGVVGAPECGDVIQVQLKISDDGVIEDARFKTFGCGSAVAGSTYITELIKGMNASKAGSVRSAQIAEEICLPPARMHCSALVEDAVKAAIGDWRRRKKQGPGPEGAGK